MDSKLASQRQRTPTVGYVLGRHAVDAADLYDIRRVLAHAGHVDLSDLREHDDRLAAHVDALLIAIDESWRLLAHNFLPVPWGVRIRVHVGRAIERVEGEDRRALVERVRSDIDRAMQSWRTAPADA